MTEVFPPFIKTRTEAAYTKRSRGVLSNYQKRLRSRINLPSITIIGNTWRGSSEIIRKLNVTVSEAFTIAQIDKGNANFCAVISWESGGVVYRYKLWENVGEILYSPLYNGELIPTSFSYEIWNTSNATISGTNATALLKKFVDPSDACDVTGEVITWTYDICYDIHFELEGWRASDGDYFELDGSCGETLLVEAITFPDYLVLQADDGTWHRLYLIRQDDGTGNLYTTYYVEQANTAAGTKAYLPLLHNNIAMALSLLKVSDGAGGFLYTPTVSGPIIDAEASPYVYIRADNDEYYTLSILPTEIAGIYMPTLSSIELFSQRLKEITESEGYELLTGVYNGDNVLTSGTVKWPDGSAGVFTTLVINGSFPKIDSFSITHTNSGKTVTQPTVTRDVNGNMTVKPELVIS